MTDNYLIKIRGERGNDFINITDTMAMTTLSSIFIINDKVCYLNYYP